jgi:SprT protein
VTERELENTLKEESFKWIDKANKMLDTNMEYPKIDCNLRGTTAGYAYSLVWKLRYNKGLARDNYKDFIYNTVPHEVAHLVADRYYNKRCHHGKEWKRVMTMFGKEPSRCHDYDVERHRLRKRTIKRHLYECGCPEPVQVGQKHHNILLRELGRVSCKACKNVLSVDGYKGVVTY